MPYTVAKTLVYIIIFGFATILLLAFPVKPDGTYVLMLVGSFLLLPVFFFSQAFKRNVEKKSNRKIKKLKDEITLLNTALDATNDGLLVINSGRKIIKYNNKFIDIFGIPRKDLKTNNEAGIYRFIKNQLRFHDQIKYLIKNLEENFSGRVELNNGDIIELYSYPVVIGGSTCRVFRFQNITSRVKYEEEINRHIEEIHETKDLMEQNAFELVKLNMKLEESEIELASLNASKDKFFSIIAHDLKSPFTALIGFTEMMIDDFESFTKEELKDYIRTMHKSTKSTLTLLQNLLNWARLQTGKIEFTPEEFDLFETAVQVTDLLDHSAQTKGIKLINGIRKNSFVTADPNMIATVFRNLISNAIKFTNPGGNVTVSLQEMEGTVQVTISDSGIGMAEEDIKKLFKIDVHHTTIGTKNETGTGLGLILCSELIAKNGGKIWCRSEINKGTQFFFTLSKPQISIPVFHNNKTEFETLPL